VIRVALVGLGAISTEHLTKLERIAGTRAVAVCDLSPTVAAAVAERFGVDRAFVDFGEMLSEVRPDAVHVLTPPQSHAALVRAALEHGAHVVVEKPIAPSWEAYVEMREVAAASERMLCENYTYRFAPVVQQALADVAAGEIGDVLSVDVSYGGVMDPSGAYGDAGVAHFAHALPGGALQNFISHPVSVALAFVDRIDRVATWQRRRDPRFPDADELRALLAGPEASATVAVSAHAQPHFLVRIQGTSADLDVDVLGETLQRRTGGHAAGAALRRGAVELRGGASWFGRTLTGRRDPYFAGLRVLLERFYGAIRDGDPPPLTVEQMNAVNAVVRDIFAPDAQL
jgi:predicted dehydrogenase